MSSSTTSANQNGQRTSGLLSQSVPCALPPLAAGLAIVIPFRDLIAKSFLQLGKPVPCTSLQNGLMQGFKAAPTIGGIVGTQMLAQKGVETLWLGNTKEKSFSAIVISSAIVGVISSPFLAVFNGTTMGWSVNTSLRKFSAKQGLAIAAQETAFVFGLSAADRLSAVMKEQFGDNKVVEYSAAFIAGATGSLAGHPANTALTRWQNGMKINHPHQLMWGAARKAYAIGIFGALYKLGKEIL